MSVLSVLYRFFDGLERASRPFSPLLDSNVVNDTVCHLTEKFTSLSPLDYFSGGSNKSKKYSLCV